MKLIGCILLIVGTSIGAGMLGLPIATATLGFTGSVILLIVCWLAMMASAFLILEANLWLPLNSNVISMAKTTLGPIGQIIAWLTYVLLLYSLLCAYIAGGSDLFHNLLLTFHLNLPVPVAAVLFTLIFGSVVSFGIRSVDMTNRWLMVIKFIAYVLLVVLLVPFISKLNLAAGNLQELTAGTALTVTITSFGFATIIPSLRVYFNGDIKKLKFAILVGSFVPLVCYIVWDAAIMGVIPIGGETGLQAMLQAKDTTSMLTNTLTGIVNKESVTFFAKLFTSVCILTSFLGVALCVTDFLADGLQVEKKGMSNIFIQLLAFLPPLAIVLFFPNIFIKGLEYAGIYTLVLLVIMPALMVWRGRYRHHMTGPFKVAGGKTLLAVLIIFALYIICRGLM